VPSWDNDGYFSLTLLLPFVYCTLLARTMSYVILINLVL
jgi:hypothetical protein